MALTELERQKDSISWEPISERADFITTLSYKRGSTIPWCRTLQKSIIRQDQTLSPHCPTTIQLFNTVSYQNTLYKRISCSRSRLYQNIVLACKRDSTFPCRAYFTKQYYEAGSNFITTLSKNYSTIQNSTVPKYTSQQSIMQKQTLSQHCIGLQTGLKSLWRRSRKENCHR